MKNNAIRHGDVILKPVNKTAGTAKELKEYTAAYGEVTGHHHTLYPTIDGAILKLWEDGEKRILELNEAWYLRHQEHNEIKVPAGLYEIGMEREYDPFEKAMRKVID